MPVVPVDIDFDTLENESGYAVDSIVATCLVCGNIAEAYGQEDDSLGYAMVELSQTCPNAGEINDYHAAHSPLVKHMVETRDKRLHSEFKLPQPVVTAPKAQPKAQAPKRAHKPIVYPVDIITACVKNAVDNDDMELAHGFLETLIEQHCD